MANPRFTLMALPCLSSGHFSHLIIPRELALSHQACAITLMEKRVHVGGFIIFSLPDAAMEWNENEGSNQFKSLLIIQSKMEKQKQLFSFGLYFLSPVSREISDNLFRDPSPSPLHGFIHLRNSGADLWATTFISQLDSTCISSVSFQSNTSQGCSGSYLSGQTHLYTFLFITTINVYSYQHTKPNMLRLKKKHKKKAEVNRGIFPLQRIVDLKICNILKSEINWLSSVMY